MSELFFVVALVAMLQGGQQVGTATGFFYSKNDAVYFVTNRHVVIDEKKRHKPDALRIRLHTDQQDLTKNVDRIIQLYQNSVPQWHVHKDHPKVPIDIAVIEFDRKLTQGAVIRALSDKNIYVKETSAFVPGEDIIVLGFPLGLSDATHNLALMRNALISSSYGINFEGQPMFLVDANLHPGMSGSPVMTKPRTIIPSKKGFTISQKPVTFLLGVFSATLSAVIPVEEEEKRTSREEALGLGAVWYAHLIEEIIADIKPSTVKK
jgi:hypothetical protein